MLIKWNVTIPTLSGNRPRKAYVWLPEDYDANPDRHYPVMYMFDGHNIFLDEHAAFGKSWGMYDYMLYTRTELIIVAIECNHEGNSRLSEYAPFTYRNKAHGLIPGRGDAMLCWMVNRLKPYVDSHLRTLPDREHTILAGSSMGGLIALYGVLAYNRVFRQAAVLSPSLWVSPLQSLAMISRAAIAPDTTIYLSYGEQEIGNHRENPFVLNRAASLLLKKKANLTFRIVPNANHSEASWEKQVPLFMECLGL